MLGGIAKFHAFICSNTFDFLSHCCSLNAMFCFSASNVLPVCLSARKYPSVESEKLSTISIMYNFPLANLICDGHHKSMYMHSPITASQWSFEWKGCQVCFTMMQSSHPGVGMWVMISRPWTIAFVQLPGS